MKGVQRPHVWAREVKGKVQAFIEEANQYLSGLNILALVYTITTCISSTTGDELAQLQSLPNQA